MFANSNVDVALDVDRNVGSLDVLDDVVNAEVLPSMMVVVNEGCTCDILLNDLVKILVVVSVVRVMMMMMMMVMRFSWIRYVLRRLYSLPLLVL